MADAALLLVGAKACEALGPYLGCAHSSPSGCSPGTIVGELDLGLLPSQGVQYYAPVSEVIRLRQECIPKVSVVTIVHNGASTLPLAISSLLMQTFECWECIIVNDASDDSTQDILDSLIDPRFKVLTAQSRLGRGRARQWALEAVSGEFVCALDADDFYFPRKLERQVSILTERFELVAVVAGLFYFDEKLEPLGVPVGYYGPGLHRIPERPCHLRLPFVGTMFRFSRLNGLTFHDVPRSEDRWFFSRLLEGCDIWVQDECDYAYRWRFCAEAVLAGLAYNVDVYRALGARHPVRRLVLVTYTQSKILFYRFTSKMGLWPIVKRLRYQKASAATIADFKFAITKARGQFR